MKKKRLLALMLSLAMALSFVPQVGAKAADETATATDATQDLTAQERTVEANDPVELDTVLIHIDEPEVGEKPDTTLEFDEDAIFATCTGKAPNGSPLGWTHSVDGLAVDFSTFELGEVYSLRFMVNVLDGNVLNNTDCVTVNEREAFYEDEVEEAGVKYYIYHVNYTMSADISKLALIDSASLRVELPSAGTKITCDEDGEPTALPTISTNNSNIVGTYGFVCKGFPDVDGFDKAFEGTIEDGQYYYVDIRLDAKEGYKFSKDTKFVVNGECRLEYLVEDDPTCIWIVAKVKAGGDENYTILDGDGQILYYGDDLTVRASGALEDLDHLEIDGKELDLQFVKLKSGSTIATIAASFLETLSEGEHRVTFVYYYGKVSTKFTIKKAANDSVKTGDTAPVAMMAGLMICALAGMVYLKKKEY